MYWISTDPASLRKLSIPSQLKYNIYWRLMSRLYRAGFFDTEEGCYHRLRDFTPLFWRTLLKRDQQRLSSIQSSIESMRERLAWAEAEVIVNERTFAIILAGVVKAAGGEVVVEGRTFEEIDKEALEVVKDPTQDLTTYRVVNKDLERNRS